MSACEIVERLSACQAAVHKLEREQVIAVDSEGVHLSRTGPLTLLQIGTAAGRVFLFDVMREPRMFKDGGLTRLLENESIVKVMHSGRNDGEALYWQHSVQLHNVHDTQLAHMEILRAGGQLFPGRMKLEEMCGTYCPEKAALLTHDKDAVQVKWNKIEGEYWAKRPFTPEMMKYASQDVIVLVPEVYMAQKRLLEEKGLTEIFRTHVDQDMRRIHDQILWDRLVQEEKELINATLKDFAATASKHTRFQDITDENVVNALHLLRFGDLPTLSLPDSIRQLKLQEVKTKVDEIEDELREKGQDFEPSNSICRRLRFFTAALDDGPIKDQAQRLQTRVNNIILEDLKKKYTMSTPAKHVADYERRALTRGIRPKGENDPSVHPVLLKLYWEAKMYDLEEDIGKFKADLNGYQVSEGYVKLLRFYVSGNVPAGLKQKGKEFLDALERMGKVAPPPRGGGRGRGSGYGGGRFRRY